MGNLCGKQSKDGFDGPGRTLGSAPPSATKASVPATESAGSNKKRIVGGPPRTLGEGNSGDDPRSAAAAAAEVRTLKRNGSKQMVLMRCTCECARVVMCCISFPTTLFG